MPNYKVAILEKNGIELSLQEELQLTASNVSATTVNGLISDEVQGQLDELAALGGAIFGTNYSEVLSNGTSETTSASWQDKIDNTFTGLVDGGKYLVMWYSEVRFSKAEAGVDVRIRLDSSTITNPAIKTGKKQEDEWFFYSGYTTKTLSGATQLKVEFQYRNLGAGTSGVRKSRLQIWRVA